jgi:hypothetical protein
MPLFSIDMNVVYVCTCMDQLTLEMCALLHRGEKELEGGQRG